MQKCKNLKSYYRYSICTATIGTSQPRRFAVSHPRNFEIANRILLGKYFAEDILKILPSGTHEVGKLISPENLAIEAEQHGIILDSFTGFTPTFRLKNIVNKEFGKFKLSSNMHVNYGAAGIKL